MSEQGHHSGHEQGAGRTGGLPGANADPGNSELPTDQAAEVMLPDVADDGDQPSV